MTVQTERRIVPRAILGDIKPAKEREIYWAAEAVAMSGEGRISALAHSIGIWLVTECAPPAEFDRFRWADAG